MNPNGKSDRYGRDTAQISERTNNNNSDSGLATHQEPNDQTVNLPGATTSSGPAQSGHAQGTQSIHLEGLFTADLTSTGSFNLKAIDDTWFGQLLHSLPIPAFLVDEGFDVVFANRAAARVGLDQEVIQRKPFACLFANVWVGRECQSLLEEVFSQRTPRVTQGALEIGANRIWGRIHLTPVRLGANRCVLVLVEDLTLEKEQLLLRQKHEKQLIEQRDDLERLVRERTAELVSANEQLRREVDERRRVEDSVRMSESKYRMLVENSPVGIFSCTIEGKVTEHNRALGAILGAPSPKEVGKLNVLEFSSPQEAQLSSVIRKCLESGTASVAEFAYKGPWGKQTFVRVHAAPLRDADATIAGALAVVEDISDHRRSEGLMVHSERFKALVQMASGMAANFNRSLQACAADAQATLTCLENRNFAEMRPLVEQIRTNVLMAAQTVRRLQQFAYTGPGMTSQRGRPFDVSEAVAEAIEKSKPWWNTQPESRGLTVSLHSEFATGCIVEGDRDELIEVVVNLIANAAEALPVGGEITVKTAARKKRVTIIVADNGIGVPQKDLDKVFDPFWTSKSDRAGMGLAVSSGIIRRHGGTISVKSKEREGTTMVVGLPISTRPSAPITTSPATTAGDRLRLLIIDDDDRAVKRLQQGLQNLGQIIFTAQSSVDGLRIFEETRLDAVVCALEMKQNNGWDLSGIVHDVSVRMGFRKPPFILLTRPGAEIAEDQIIAHPHVDRVIEKPVKATRLLEVITEELRGAGPSMAFSGSIYGIDILEYVQLMTLTSQQAVLEIQAKDGERGLLYIDRGSVRHATCGDLEGEPAFHRCLTFRSGNFSSLPWREPEKVTINKPSEYLLFEAARKRDETVSPVKWDRD